LNSPVSAAQLATLKSANQPDDRDTITLAFDDNRLLSLLFGEHDEHLALIEHRMVVAITPRGNRVSIRGLAPARDGAKNVLTQLYQRARRGLEINRGEVEGAIRMNQSVHDKEASEGTVRTRRKLVMPRTPMQKNYVEAIRKNELVFSIGPAGTGKTIWLLPARGSPDEWRSGPHILSRPAVEAGDVRFLRAT
jgi:phosphate starvation-inducible PhoH-like protein